MSLLVLLSGLDKNQYDITLLLPAEGMVSERASEMGLHVEYFDMHPMMIERKLGQSLQNSLQSVLEIGKIRQLIRTLQVDLVHVNSYRVGVPFFLAARNDGIPVVWHLRDIPESGMKKRLLATACRLPAKIIAISAAVARAVGIEDAANTEIIYNGVDLPLFENGATGEFRSSLDVTHDAILLCSIGQLIPWKGHDFLIKAFAALADDPRLYLVIVGGNVTPRWADPDIYLTYPQTLRDLVAELGLQGRVIFTGFRRNIPQILADVDLYVHATTAPEPFGRVLVEAMAACKPVVAPDWGGIPEIVDDGVTGLLYQPQDLPQLQSQLSELIEDRARLKTMGEAGRSRAKALFSSAQYVQAISALYQNLLG